MTEDKINKGTELLYRLKNLREDRKVWEKAVRLHNITLTAKYEYIDKNDVYFVRSSYINFEKLKEDTLANIDRMIEEIQKEFDKL